jgi:hypothetical protein
MTVGLMTAPTEQAVGYVRNATLNEDLEGRVRRNFHDPTIIKDSKFSVFYCSLSTLLQYLLAHCLRLQYYIIQLEAYTYTCGSIVLTATYLHFAVLGCTLIARDNTQY